MNFQDFQATFRIPTKPSDEPPTDLQEVMDMVGVHVDAIRGEFQVRIATAENSLVAKALNLLMEAMGSEEQDLLTGRTSLIPPG